MPGTEIQNDDKRQNEPHQKHRSYDAYEQETFPPKCTHGFKHAGVHYGVVYAVDDFKDDQPKHDYYGFD